MRKENGARIGKMMLRLTLSICILAMMAVSCSKENSADISDLLKGVPADASAVMIINSGEILEDAGCKVKDGKAELSDQINQMFDNLAKDGKDGTSLKELLTGEAGCDVSAVVCFMEGYNGYFSGMINDPGKFKAWAEKATGKAAQSEKGVTLIDNIGIKDNRFWMTISGANYINAEEVSRFASLSDNTSFLSNQYAEMMCKSEDDIIGWGELKGFFRFIGGRNAKQDVISALTVSTLFDDGQYIVYDFNFEKGKAEGSAKVLDSKGENAKFLLPMSKIDAGTVKLLGDKSDVIAAVALNRKLMDKLEEIAKSFGGGFPATILSKIKTIDGTACVAMSEQADMQEGIVTTTGEGTADLIAMLNTFGTVTKDGKLVKVSSKPVEGELSIAAVADSFKDAMLAVRGVNNQNEAVESYNLMLLPKGNSMEVKFGYTLTDAKGSSVTALFDFLK